MRLNVNVMCASEFALAIALTVFILLTVTLAVLLIFLAASKNFRAVFFREKSRKKKSTKKQPAAVSEPTPVIPHGGVDTIPIDPPKAARRTSTRKTEESDVPEFLNAIPTVPLNGFPQAAPTPRGGKAKASGMRMSEIPSDEQGGTYTARMITITRARQSSAPTKSAEAKSDKTDKADKTDKTETSRSSRTTKKR